ncbi:glucans biosynthesis glucosyltransferase MdoH [Cognatazoarcus halotolerans]|uniref:glucans biosynthesis glucosyltransferase MdoH n=1 Tax=Cognatazoarcus halotolerans TaxID=2686016 RepID=UPI00135C068D|nr:glucans biosynthesis glucosyltransferase MdoH [Cognatazoarcus halotolerans]MCB1898564.1 glucans biosynthesis glucosyltransferase MdoH [Rhodocyclaceae bacterium]MCP5310215.1 glucans biosynthesis glucosyltransferase MdoH [Zoogloeaceae bacterium]
MTSECTTRPDAADPVPSPDPQAGRLAALYRQLPPGRSPHFERDTSGKPILYTAPALNRSSMAPREWLDDDAATPSAAEACAAARPPKVKGRDRLARLASLRRFILVALMLGQTYVATSFMTAVLPYHGQKPLEMAVLVLFAVLFCWVSAGFWTALWGFMVLIMGGDRHAISRTAAPDAPIGASARTAIIMPICNEDVDRVFAGLRASYASLARSGDLEHFDFFVLSDSGDPDARAAEMEAWHRMCRELDCFDRVFYRWRQHRIKRKSGNVADFCRRWGKNYRYMIGFDADSVMTGDCMGRLVRLMEANPDAGIIQTGPRAAGRDTFYARMQQFATRVYGPLFTAGLHYWQLGESHYWGHNAIIRVEPFMRHCALARLPGKGSLSGEILSHDFVEAALMRRAGWGVWLAYDLPGSYEEMPPNLDDELKRDRRWCQGNLMNFRLFLSRGLHPAHRAVFMTGVMAYLSAPLWFLSLILSTILLAIHTLSEPQYFVEPNQLFPLWPEWHPEWALGLFGATATLLFLPKVLAVILLLVKGSRGFGGGLRLILGALLETLLSALLAPVRMLFHTQFVLGALLGIGITWRSPQRADSETGWLDALRRHGLHSLLGIGWAGFVYWLNPSFLWWLLPVAGALALSIPVSVFTSRVSIGRGLRENGILLIPEESQTPRVLRTLREEIEAAPGAPGFREAVVDPDMNAVIRAVVNRRTRFTAATRAARRALVEEAALRGPEALDRAQKMTLLSDADSLYQLHQRVWTSPESHDDWYGPAARQTDAQTTIPEVLGGPRGSLLAALRAARGSSHAQAAR